MKRKQKLPPHQPFQQIHPSGIYLSLRKVFERLASSRAWCKSTIANSIVIGAPMSQLELSKSIGLTMSLAWDFRHFKKGEMNT